MLSVLVVELSSSNTAFTRSLCFPRGAWRSKFKSCERLNFTKKRMKLFSHSFSSFTISILWTDFKLFFFPFEFCFFLDKMVIKLTDRSNWRSSRPMHLFTSNPKQKKNGWAINHFSDGISQTDKKKSNKNAEKNYSSKYCKRINFPNDARINWCG